MFRSYAILAQAVAIMVAAFLIVPNANAQGPAAVDAHMQWWKDARFGMFIHWGPISIKGTEISWSRNPNPGGANPNGIPAAEYDSLYRQFDPVKFDANAIVALAKAAGMKYVVFTCKHHDGFCEFDSQYTDYKITSPQSPYGKDIVRQLADATHAAGLHWCVYYSQPDIHNPDYKVNQPAYDTYFHNQVHELLTNYGKVDLIWFDGLGGSASFWDAQNLFAQMRAVNPNLIINNRCGLPGDYRTPEQKIGAYDDQNPWETCMTIGDQWAYRPNDRYKTSQQCIQTLARCVGGDGNLLLNIGLRPDGTVDPTQADRLHAIADWMKVSSAAIYGTRGGPYKPTSDFASTRKDNKVYLHVFKWDGDKVVLPALPKQITSSRLLGGGSVRVSQTSDAVTVTVPAKSHDTADTVVELTVDGSAMDMSPIASAAEYTATASNTYENNSEYGPDMAFDGDESTRWATDSGTKQCWISAELPVPKLINGVDIGEAYAGRVQKFQFQYKPAGGADWVTLVEGTQIGANYKATFNAVTAKSIRLNILDATDGPTISEIKLLAGK